MNGNVFTDAMRTQIPYPIQTFFKNHQIRMYFKHELMSTFASNTQKRMSNNFVLKRLDTLKRTLLNTCNPVLSKRDEEAFLKSNNCHTYYEEHNTPNEDRFIPSIEKSYLYEKWDELFHNTDYDIVVLVSTVNELTVSIYKRILGFVLTQQSECKDRHNKFTNIPALALICAAKGHKHDGIHTTCNTSCKYVGRTLMYLYLYALKKAGYPYGILELAGAYCNMSGLCLYNKFGFREDLAIKSKSCFGYTGTLPMVATLSKISYRNLETALMSTTSESVPIENEEPLCKGKRGLIQLQNETRQRMNDNDELLNMTQKFSSLSVDCIKGKKKDSAKPFKTVRKNPKKMVKKCKPKNTKRNTRRRPREPDEYSPIRSVRKRIAKIPYDV